MIAILGGAAFAITGVNRFSGRAYSAAPMPTLLVTDDCTGAVTAYAAASNGDVTALAPAATGLTVPQFLAVDTSGNIYVTNACNNSASVTIYAKGSTGVAAPIAAIGGNNTGLSYPQGIAVDSKGKIYVADENTARVFVYAAGSTGNVAPIAIIGGGNTGLSYPQGVAVDSSGQIYVADYDAQSVFVYPAVGSSSGLLDESPTATISGGSTGLSSPNGVAVDSGDKIYVADDGAPGAPSVLVYSAGSNGDVAPINTISGSNTSLSYPQGIAVDSGGKIYVADYGADKVLVFSAGSNGNVAAIDSIGGSNTGLSSPTGLGLDSSSKIYVADDGASGYGPGSVFAYSSGSSGNVAPLDTISTTVTTGLSYAQGIAVDSGGQIYVADDGPGGLGPSSVFVYAAGSNAGTAPIATISGSNTGLVEPKGVALDSSGNIYVTDFDEAAVFVYPSLAISGTGQLNEVPIAAIDGSGTNLLMPEGIAVDSGGEIYVVDYGARSVVVYAAGSNGNVAPIATISGTNTSLRTPAGIALDSSGNIYVADGGRPLVYPPILGSVFVYPSLAISGTGLLNESPIATISGSGTGLRTPEGIAVDSSGSIYAADNTTASVFVYPAGSSGNVAPAATITGPLTELLSPAFVAIQPPGASPTPTPTATATATATATPTSTPTPSTAKLTISPKSVSFGKSTVVGSVSKPKMVTIKNASSKKSGIAVSITNQTTAAPFAVTSGCRTTLAPGQSCKVSVTFSPTDTTARSGNLTINDNEAGAPQEVPLSGTGKAAKK